MNEEIKVLSVVVTVSLPSTFNDLNHSEGRFWNEFKDRGLEEYSIVLNNEWAVFRVSENEKNLEGKILALLNAVDTFFCDESKVKSK